MASVEERLKTLEADVRVLRDREEILRTLYQYAHCMDRGRSGAQFVDCFIETGVWRSSPATKTAGTAGDRVEGHKALADWFLRMGRADPKWWEDDHLMTNHNQTMPDIHIDGDRATVETYMTVTAEDPKGPYIWAIGRYLDKFVRCPDGRWRFEERHLSREGVQPRGQVRPITNYNPAEEAANRERIRAEREAALAARK